MNSSKVEWMEGLSWLVPVGLLSCGAFYLILQRVVVKWICSTLLSGRVQLEKKGELSAASLGSTILHAGSF